MFTDVCSAKVIQREDKTRSRTSQTGMSCVRLTKHLFFFFTFIIVVFNSKVGLFYI